MSVRLRNKWLWIRVPLQSLKFFFCLTGHFWCWRSHLSFFLFNRSFLVLTQITLQFTCCSGGAVSTLFLSSFYWKLWRSEEVLDQQKITFFTLFLNISHFIQYFSQNILACIGILFPKPLKSKAEQGWHFHKSTIPEGYSMSSHTNTL